MTDSSDFYKQLCAFCTPLFGIGVLLGLASIVSLLALFYIHASTLWLSADPEKAFHRARLIAGYTASGWNSVREVYNGARTVAFFWVPSYNLAVKHAIEPAAWITLDVLSLVFARKHYSGVITEEDVPFLGHYCGAPGAKLNEFDPVTKKWCSFGSTDMWADELHASGTTDGVSAVSNGSVLLLSTAQARRLATLAAGADAEGLSIFPTLFLAPLAEAIEELSGVLTMLSATFFDVTAHIVYTILSEIAVVIFNMVQVLLRGITSVIMAVVRSGALQSIITLGVDLLTTLVVYVAIPLLLATLDVFLCFVNYAQPGTWDTQLACVERVCFKESTGDAGSEIFNTFTSISIIGKALHDAVQALINPLTGRNYGEAGTGTTDVPDVDQGTPPTVASETCAACFTCRVPELRALWLLVASTYGCVRDESRFGGRVENACMDDGSYYINACGPRFAAALPHNVWEATYTEHRNFDSGRNGKFAGLFHQLAQDLGGGTSNGYSAQYVADAWRNRNKAEGVNMASRFYRRVCETMRDEFDNDVGPGHVNQSEGTLGYIAGQFLYESCKAERFELCSNSIAQRTIDTWYEFSNCLFDMPQCRRDRDVCLGSCGGNATGLYQDFMTDATKQMLSQRVLGAERLAKGRANCHVRNRVISVPLFEGIGSDAFIEYSSRLRVRSGALAIDPRACERNPAACAAVLRVIERDPTLTFVNGRFVAAHELSAPLPPYPSPPPPLLRLYASNVYDTNPRPPPSTPPAPPQPPPWYANSETCIPVVTSAEADVEVRVGEEERAVCVYVRAIASERLRAQRCFAATPPSPPPPPPTSQSVRAAITAAALERRVRQGGTSGPEATPDLSSEEEYIQ